jgi:hypothetical protein
MERSLDLSSPSYGSQRLTSPNFDNTSLSDSTPRNPYERDRLQAMEASPAGRSRIHEQHTRPVFHERPVAVPEHDDQRAGLGTGVRQLMYEVEPHTAEIEVLVQPEPECVLLLVIVAVDRIHRRHISECIKHVHAANVTRMHDRVDTCERCRKTRIDVAVCIRDDPDQHPISLTPGRV